MMPNVKKVSLGLFLILVTLLPWVVGDYILHLFIQVITYSMLGLAFGICWKVRLIRIDLAGWWGVGAYTTGVLMTKADMSFWPTMLLGGLIAVLIGWGFFSISIPRGGLAFFAFGFLIALLLQQMFAAVDFFGGWGGIEVIPRPTIGSFVFTGKTGYYFLGLFLLVVNLVAYYLLYNSKIGRAWTAIGSSVSLAKSLGINVFRYRIATALLGNFFVAVAGSYYAGYSLFIIPNTFGFLQSIYAQMYALLGGLSYYLAGPVIGAAILTFVPEYLRIAAEVEPIFTAGVIILIVIFMPQGILGLIHRRVVPVFTRMRAGKRW